MKPEQVRHEIRRLEARRVELAPEVMGGNRSAVEEDRGLERRIMELASAEREGRSRMRRLPFWAEFHRLQKDE